MYIREEPQDNGSFRKVTDDRMNTMKNELFADVKINTTRQPELDVAKALPILCLPFVHVIIECTSEEGLLHGIPFLFDAIIGAPFSAPMFMFAMGIGIAYTSVLIYKSPAKRFLKLMAVGYALNICRFLIPYLLGYALTKDTAQYIEPLWYKVFGNDILQFAPLALLAMGLFFRMKMSKTSMFVTALAMSLVGWMLNGTDFHNPALNIFMGNFIGTEQADGLLISDWPLLNWLIIPVCGYIFGEYLLRVKDKKKFYLWLMPILLVPLIYFPLAIHYETGMFMPGENAYYHAVTYELLVYICLSAGLLGVYYFLLRYIPERLMRFFEMISRNITAFYCIHWVLISFSVSVFLYIKNGTQELPVSGSLFLSFVICVLTAVIIHIRDKNRKKGMKADEKQ